MSWIDASPVVTFDEYGQMELMPGGTCGACGVAVSSTSRWDSCGHTAFRTFRPVDFTYTFALAESFEMNEDGWVYHPVKMSMSTIYAMTCRPDLHVFMEYRMQADGDRPKCFRCCAETEDLTCVRMANFNLDYRVCRRCLPHCGHISQCIDCDQFVDADAMNYVITATGHYAYVCGPCYDENGWGRCGHCEIYSRGSDELSCCDPDEDGIVPDCRCYDCNRARNRRPSAIFPYSYRPELRFLSVGGDVRHGVDPRGKIVDRTTYLGFELEVEVDREQDLHHVSREFSKGMGEDFYLKSDGSIGHGFEIVSHPMTLDYAMKKVDWSVIRRFRKDRIIRSADNCGMHVHVSKAAFSGKAHIFRWMMFFYRNRLAMQAVAGRESSYARFDNTNRGSVPGVVKGIQSGRDTERYSAINMINEHTFEVRIFESSVFVNRVQAYLQLVEATVEYTRHLVSSKVMKDGGFSFAEFRSWLNGNRSRYAHLIQRIKATVTEGAYQEPIRETMYGFREVRFDAYGDPYFHLGYRDVVVQEI